MRFNRTKSLIIDYKSVFGSEAGKAVLADLTKRAPLFGGLDIKPGVDTNKLLVMQGRSDVLLYIYKMLKKNPYSEREEHATNQGE